MIKIVVTHPTGNANVRATVNGLFKQGILAQFNTTIASFPGNKFDLLGGIKPFAEFRRRSFHPSLQQVTTVSPSLELMRHASVKFGWPSLVKHEKGPFCIDKIQRSLDRKVADRLAKARKKGINAVYSYEDGAAFTFASAKKNDIHCFYDLPTGYWRAARRLLEVEKEKWPEWVATMTSFQDSSDKLQRKDDELRLADMIFVASQFTANTLQDFPGTLPPVNVIPYGFPPVGKSRNFEEGTSYSKRRLKILFVGKLTQQKGLADLLAALEGLENELELTLVGRKTGECEALNKALVKHRWIPTLPHHEVLQLMREHDILAFPSLFDGFGLVMTEAMAQGTPVIASDRCAGPDLIEHGKNGWLVEGGNKIALRKSVEEVLNNRERIPEIGEAAMKKAVQRPWDMYSSELFEAIEHYFKNQA